MIKNFSCFKVVEKKSDKSPDYRLTAKVGDEFVEVGAGWIKDSAKGKFISFKLSDPYQDRVGFTLIQEGEVEKVMEQQFEKMTEPVVEYPKDDIKPDDMGF